MTTAPATVPLALLDFLPVGLAGLGAILLARVAGRRAPSAGRPALTGALLVLAGGMCKAGWKLILAVNGDDLPFLQNLLFPCLATGFVLLCLGLRRAQGRTESPYPALGVLVVAALAAAVLHALWPLLIVAIVAATAFSILAILLARELADRPAVLLFAVQLLMAFALVPLAGEGQSIAHQYWEESLNTIGQGAFALAALRLLARRPVPVLLTSLSRSSA